MFVADHLSNDRTPEILADLERELDHLEFRRVRHSAESHALIEPFVGTDTWILSVDGDELYDPMGLATFRDELTTGVFDSIVRLRPAGLHCDELDDERGLASGYLSPPSRPLVGLLNFAALDSWTDVRTERLHGGDVTFRPGFDWDSWRHLGADYSWESSPFRCVHVCFLRRSSCDAESVPPTGRPNLGETGVYRRGVLGPVERVARRVLGRSRGTGRASSAWKAEKYRRGERVTVDTSSFFGRVPAA
jgi:hypothetical protein